MVTLKRYRNQRYYNKTQKRKNLIKEIMNNNTSCLVINTKLIQSNINIIRKVSGTEIMPVIKGNAYGHGAVEIAKFLRSIGIGYIGVATVNEALELRNSGDKGRILAWLYDSYSRDVFNAFHNDIEIAIFDEEAIPRIIQDIPKGKTVNITVFVDTGFNRTGIRYERALDVIQKLSQNPSIKIEGLMSHLIDDLENFDNSLVKEQLSKFRKLRNDLAEIDIRPIQVHIADTNACLNYDVSDFTISRVGVGIFGFDIKSQIMKKYNIQPVMTLHTRILQIKSIKKGECIGYGCDYVSPKNMTICILGIGYGDIPIYDYTGIYYFIHGTRRRVLGKTNMDQIVCVSKPGDRLHDIAYLYGGKHTQNQTIDTISHKVNTLSSEISSHIGNRVKRVYS
jgi:alanine racemase